MRTSVLIYISNCVCLRHACDRCIFIWIITECIVGREVVLILNKNSLSHAIFPYFHGVYAFVISFTAQLNLVLAFSII